MGKDILVVAATVKEVEVFLNKLRPGSGLIAGHRIDLLISGIGLTSTTYHLAKQVGMKRPQLIIQAGIAGCFDKQIPLGTVVVVKQDTIADEMVVESKKLKTVFDLKLVPPYKPPYIGGWLINKTDVLDKTGLKKVRAVSVNQVTTSTNMITLYRKKFNPVVESMEGAALHYTGLSENIPFVQLRSISNYIGERNKKNWKIKEAIRSLNAELNRLLSII